MSFTSLQEFVDHYGLRQDKKGDYYLWDTKKKRFSLNEKGKKLEPYIQSSQIQAFVNIGNVTMFKRLRRRGVEYKEHPNGKAHYNLNQVIKAFPADFLWFPQADRHGAIYINGVKFLSLPGLCKLTGVGRSRLKKLIVKLKIRPTMGLTTLRREREFFPADKIVQALRNEKSFQKGHSSAIELSKRYKINKALTISILRRNRVPFIHGASVRGDRIHLYQKDLASAPLARAGKRLELLKKLPKVGPNGLIRRGGRIFGNKESLSRKLSISPEKIARRIVNEKNYIMGASGIYFQTISKFYDLEVVKERCSDLLVKLPKANTDGVLRHKRAEYATVGKLSRILGNLDGTSLQTNLVKAGISPVRGVAGTGHQHDYYPVKEAKVWHKKIYLKRFRPMTVTHPSLVEEYDPANELLPDQIVAGTHKRLKWICKTCGFKFTQPGKTRIRGTGFAKYRKNHGRGCLKCAKKKMRETRRKNKKNH